MKILKYGDGYPKTVVCECCESELEYDALDIGFKMLKNCCDLGDGRVRGWEASYIVCPVCRHTNILNTKKIIDYT